MSEPLYKLKAEFFKTLGHPARIRILELLVAGDKSVAELLPEVGLESSNLSQQLGVLRRAGVVDALRDGNTVIYSIASPDIAELLLVARKVLTGVLSDRVAVLEDLRANGGGVAPMGWIGKVFRVGRITEPAPPVPQRATRSTAAVRGSLQIRHVDAGSCNGCEVEIAGRFGPVYDAERFGARLVASPRHADALLVTGVVTRNMAEPLRATLERHPAAAVGDRLRGLCFEPGRIQGRLWRGGRGGRRGARRRGNRGVPAGTEPDHRRAAIGDRQVTALLSADGVHTSETLSRAEFGPAVAGASTSLIGAGGVAAGVLGMFGSVHSVRIGWLLPLSGVQLELDPLGGFFMALAGAVAVAVGPYLIGYARREHLGGLPLAVLPAFVAAMLLVPAAGSVDHLPAGVGIDGRCLGGVGADRAHPRAGSLRGVGVCGDDPVGFRGDPGRAGGALGGRSCGPVRRVGSDTARSAHRGVPVDDGGVRIQGRAGAAACLVAARPPRGAQPGFGADERRDGQHGRLRDLPSRPSAAGPGPALVGTDLDGDRRGVGALRRGAGFGGDGSQTAPCLFDDREPRADHAGLGCRDAVRRLRCGRTGDDRGGRGDAAPGCARGVQRTRIPGRGVGAGRDRVARPGPAGRTGPPNAHYHNSFRSGRARGVRIAAGRRFRQRMAVGAVTDPHGTRARHHLVADDAARGRRGRAHHGCGRGSDGQGVRDRVSRAAALPGSGRGRRGACQHADRYDGRGRRLPGAGGGALGDRARAAPGGRRPARGPDRRTDRLRRRGAPARPAGFDRAGGDRRRRRRGRGDRGHAGAVASGKAPGTRHLAAVGLWRRRSHRTHAVHGHVVRRAVAAGVQRRPSSGHRHRGHARRRVAVSGRQDHLPDQNRRRHRGAPLHPGDSGRCWRRRHWCGGPTPAACIFTWPTVRSAC